VGIELGYKEKMVAVAAPIKGGPAEKMGIKAGDIIVHAKDEKKQIDEDAYDWNLLRAQQVLRGEIGTQVTVTLYREGYNDDLPFEVAVVRDEIKVDSLTLEWREVGGKQVAYMSLSRFSERTYTEWNEMVDEIVERGEGVAGVILDLRNNPGGYFGEAIHVASEFIDKGVVVSEQGLSGKRDFPTSGKGRLTKMPVIVLVNKGSASSSEIVAGALRDNLGARLVGEQTFGKGLIQERIGLKNDAGLTVTIAKWVLPSGEWIGEEGLAPDLEATNEAETEEDEVLEAALGMVL
jgi:carboxyl-terminal processing protease